MIFYFTGTGNSFYVANFIAHATGEKCIDIAAELKKKDTSMAYTLAPHESIAFIFPIYAWAAPQLMLDFLKKATFHFEQKPFVYAIATCGANVGDAFKHLSQVLQTQNLHLSSTFSLVMPNNYIILGDVDSPQVQEEKLQNAVEKLNLYLPYIQDQKTNIHKVIKGPLPYIMTFLLNPLFNRQRLSGEKFQVHSNCIQCGLCVKICPVDNISFSPSLSWGNRCIQCLACIHRCPVRAIDFGKQTQKKGRYVHPILKNCF